MNRQAWRDFFITIFFLGLAFLLALLSSVAAEQRTPTLAAVAAGLSLILALMGALYIIPRLARNIRLEILRFAIRTTVTVEGLLFVVFLAVIGIAAWNTGNNLLYLVLSAMLAFLVAANLVARVSLADVSVQLRFPDHIFAGEPANISVTLINHKRFAPSYSLMIEALSEGAEDDEDLQSSDKAEGESDSRTPGLGRLAYFVLTPSQSSARQRSEHTFRLRGRYPITGFRIATRFPAGFFKKWRRVDATGEIVVYPKPRPLDDFYHALPMLVGQVRSHLRGTGDDLYGIRRYQATDHLRHIDWKATAKAMQMMVREHMREDERRLTIVFDTAPPPSTNGAETQSDLFREKFEKAIVMAASLANHFILEGADVELITTDASGDVSSGSGYEHLYRILRSLATMRAFTPPGNVDPKPRRRRWLKRNRPEPDEAISQYAGGRLTATATAWRLLEEVPVLADERRFKVLITSAAKGTIPAHVWRSAHVVFMDDL